MREALKRYGFDPGEILLLLIGKTVNDDDGPAYRLEGRTLYLIGHGYTETSVFNGYEFIEMEEER
jgi:hypothetical protein